MSLRPRLPVRLRLGAAFALVLVATPAAAATPADTVVMAKQIDDMISLDPAESFEVSGQEAIGNLYDKLLAADPHHPGQVLGRLAEGWSVAADGRTFTFRIRAGVRFASGNPLTAADIAFSLRRAVRLDRSPAFILGQFGLTPRTVRQRITAPAPDRLVLVTAEPVAPSLLYLCLTAAVGSVVDSRLVREHARDGDFGNRWLKTHSAGSGPFVLRVWRADERYTLLANPTYWAGAPAVRRVIVVHVPEPSMQRLLLERGDVDYARNLGPDQLRALAGRPDVAIEVGAKSGLLYLALNQRDDVLARPDVREALKYLVDYGKIAVMLAPSFAVHQSPLPDGLLGAVDAQPYRFDPAHARDLLAKAGLGQGFSVRLDTQGAAPWIEIAQVIQANFAAAGVRLAIVPADLKQILTRYRARNHQIAMLTWDPDYPDPHSNAQAFVANPDNRPDAAIKTLAWRNSWADPALTRLAAAAAREPDDARRAALYGRLQARFEAVAPFVVMFQESEAVAHRRTVDGFVIGAGGAPDAYRFLKKRAAGAAPQARAQ